MTIGIIIWVIVLTIPMLAFRHSATVRIRPLDWLKILLMLISLGLAIFSLSTENRVVLGLVSLLLVCLAFLLSNYREYESVVRFFLPKLEMNGQSTRGYRAAVVVSKLGLLFMGAVIIWLIYLLQSIAGG